MHKRLLVLLLLWYTDIAAQSKPISYEQQSWVAWFPQVKFSRRWGAWMDAELHTNDHYFNGFSQATFRLAASYYTLQGRKFTAGYGFTDFFPAASHSFISVPEHHSWEQYQWTASKPRHKLMQWIRAEQKFKADLLNDHTLSNSYTVTHKLRYNIFYTLALSKQGLQPHTLALAMGNELYLYYGPLGHNHVFDQNRVFLGFSYAVNSHDNLVFGVTNIMQENSSGTAFTNVNVLRLSLFQNITL